MYYMPRCGFFVDMGQSYYESVWTMRPNLFFWAGWTYFHDQWDHNVFQKKNFVSDCVYNRFLSSVLKGKAFTFSRFVPDGANYEFWGAQLAVALGIDTARYERADRVAVSRIYRVLPDDDLRDETNILYRDVLSEITNGVMELVEPHRGWEYIFGSTEVTHRTNLRKMFCSSHCEDTYYEPLNNDVLLPPLLARTNCRADVVDRVSLQTKVVRRMMEL